MKKELMLSINEIREIYPLGKTKVIDEKECVIIGYEQPQASNCMASYPKIIYELKEHQKEI